MTEEEQLLQKRFLDLSRQADYKGIVLFSDFLGLNEQNIFRQTEGMLTSGFQMSGGYEYAERQMVAFCPDALYYEWEYPFSCLKIEPAYPKFSDKLGHRDILGAVMNLGIERGKIGDILLKNNTAYLFCADSVKPYVTEQLEKVKHTVVKVTETDVLDNPDIQPEFEHLSGIITSNRLDAFLACICKLSRSAASSMITGGKVCINGRHWDLDDHGHHTGQRRKQRRVHQLSRFFSNHLALRSFCPVHRKNVLAFFRCLYFNLIWSDEKVQFRSFLSGQIGGRPCSHMIWTGGGPSPAMTTSAAASGMTSSAAA